MRRCDTCESIYWPGRIEASGATCFVLDANRFRSITDSWTKTNKQDPRDLARALWIFLITGEFGIPTVYKPSQTIRTLRRLSAAYNVLNRRLRMAKIAMIRRRYRVMRRMLLEGEQFHSLKEELYKRKLRQYCAALEHGQREQNAAWQKT